MILLRNPILEIAFSVRAGTNFLRSGSQETDPQIKISMQKVVAIDSIPVGK